MLLFSKITWLDKKAIQRGEGSFFFKKQMPPKISKEEEDEIVEMLCKPNGTVRNVAEEKEVICSLYNTTQYLQC